MNYYNEFEPYAAQWLRNLIAAGLIPAGDVDTRSITDVEPSDLAGYRQCHFFAGIGGWSLAARLAGWPDDRELWTGSAPCQPFSVAGKGKAQADDRHLWPHLFRLARARRPAVLMGEQVAAAVGKDWIDGVFTDLEGVGYACGASVVPACAVDAPHRRDRLWFVAHAERTRGGCEVERGESGRSEAFRPAGGTGGSGPSIVAHGDGPGSAAGIPAPARRFEGLSGIVDHSGGERLGSAGRSTHCRPLADADCLARRQGRPLDGGGSQGGGAQPRTGFGGCYGGCGCLVSDSASLCQREPDHQDSAIAAGRASWALPVKRSHWDGAGWLIGHDGKLRRVEPSIRLLAHGVPARVGRLRAGGNAIVPQVAAEVIGAYQDCYPELA